MASPLSSPLPKVNGISHSRQVSSTIVRNSTVGAPMAVHTSMSSHGSASNNLVKDQNIHVRRRFSQALGTHAHSHHFDTSFLGLLEWIRSERLKSLPHKGSKWDRVLISAQYFGEQVNSLHNAAHYFTAESDVAAHFIFGNCLVLLELGRSNASALEKAFDLFHQFGLELSFLLKQTSLFTAATVIQEHVGRAYSDLLNIVAGVAIHFYQAVHNDTASTTVDLYAAFGGMIDTFRARRISTTEEMWRFSLRRESTTDLVDISAMRKWLAPQDSTLAFLTSTHVNLSSQRAEYTCAWFQPQLAGFLRSTHRTMAVEGKTGSGKTTLANWIVDRLHRPIGRKTVSTLSFFFDQNIAGQESSVALLKALLFQILEQETGDVVLYRILNETLVKAQKATGAGQYEDVLWIALKQALSRLNKSREDATILIVDAVDEIRGGKPAAEKLCRRLDDAISDLANIRFIPFSQPLSVTPEKSMKLSMTSEHNAEEIRTLVRQSISGHVHIEPQQGFDYESLVERTAVASDGSLLFATLACDLIRLQKSQPSIIQTVQTLETVPGKVAEVVQKLLAEIQPDSASKSILAWLITAERPLSVTELTILSQIQPEKGVLVDRPLDVDSMLVHLRPFIITGEGLVALRHNAIKQAFLTIPGQSKVSLQLNHRHKDFVTRLFIYIKSSLHEKQEPTFDIFDFTVATQLFHQRRALEYAVRYWPTHTKLSTFFKESGPLELPADVTNVFPDSVVLAMLERVCWDQQTTTAETLDMHLIATRVRTAVFKGDNPSLLQSLITVAVLYETFIRHQESLEYYYRAMKMSRTVLGVQSEVTILCTNSVIRISESFTSKSRTTSMTYREEAFLVLISVYEHRYGSSSTVVIDAWKKLAEFYTFINEQHKVTEIDQKIRTITTKVEVQHNDNETVGETRHLDVKLQKHHDVKQIDTYTRSIFTDFQEDKEVWNISRIDTLIAVAREHAARGEVAVAEELYIELWVKLTEQCRALNVLEWHEKKIQLMLIYSKFLESQKRTYEASSILLCVWKEYEIHEFSMSEKVVNMLKEVAVTMKTLGLTTVALAIFQKCASFYKHTGREQTSSFKEVSQNMSVINREIMESTKSTKSLTTHSESETREIFESSFFSSETETESTTMELGRSLTSTYIEQKRYSEATKYTKMVLKKTWSSFFLGSVETLTLPSKNTTVVVDMVYQLAHCYIQQRRLEKAEQVYLRLFHAVRRSRKLDDALVVKVTQTILTFYHEHHFTDKTISFYQELLAAYRSFYGSEHTTTIQTLYTLGSLCRTLNRTHGYWIEYYLEIVRSLNKGSLVCHKDSIDALVIVANYYYEDGRYVESLTFFEMIAATFHKHGVTYTQFKDTTLITTVFERYMRSLEESRTDIKTQISICKQFREACIRHYGEAAVVSTEVTVKLASVCEKSEEHESEALSLYEHAAKNSSSSSLVTKAKQTIRSMHYRRISSAKSSSSSTSTSRELTESTSSFMHEQYSESRKSLGITHTKTLTELSELLSVYRRQSKNEEIVKELRSALTESFSAKVSSKALIETAKSVAEMYKSYGHTEQAQSVSRELRTQVITKSTANVQKFGFDVTSKGRDFFVFIASFESALYHISFSECMADLLAEALFYERYSHSLKSDAKLEVVFGYAAKLRSFMHLRKRVDFIQRIDQECVDVFNKKEVSVAKSCSPSAVHSFVVLILEYFGEHQQAKIFVKSIGHAAIARIQVLLHQNKHKEAYEVTTCTYKYLMAHQGLNDPSEIGLGLHLCLLMSGRKVATKSNDQTLHRSMLELSRQMLAEVLEICNRAKMNLAQLLVSDLNELICLMGEQQDYSRLQALLKKLWNSREGQTTWSQATTLALVRRLIEAEFSAGQRISAIRLCEDIVYNVRRVHGAKHPHTFEFYQLLGQLYTATALYHHHQPADKDKSSQELGRSYFKKAMGVHEEALKLLTDDKSRNDAADAYDSDEDQDLDTEIGQNGHPSPPLDGPSRAALVDQVRAHVRLLKLAYQRLGGWAKPAGVTEYDRITRNVWSMYGVDGELKLTEAQALASKWDTKAFGNGKAESEEDVFAAPISWAIV